MNNLSEELCGNNLNKILAITNADEAIGIELLHNKINKHTLFQHSYHNILILLPTYAEDYDQKENRINKQQQN